MIRLFRVFIPTSVVALLFSEGVIIFVCYLLSSFLVLDLDTGLFFLLDELGWVRIALVVLCIMFGVYFHDLYTKFRIHSRLLLIQQLSIILGIAFFTQAVLVYARRPEWTLPKMIMILGSGMALVVLPLWRIVYERLAVRTLGSERLLFLGESSLVEEICAHLSEHPELGFRAIGYLNNPGEPEGGAMTIPLLGELGDIEAVAKKFRPNRIVVGMSERRQRLPTDKLLRLRFSGIHIEDALTTYEATFGRICTRQLRPSQLIFSAELGPRPKSVLIQSMYSMTFATIGTILSLPLMLIAAVLVKLSSPGPILFRQNRVGLNGTPFMVYKFRSMYADAEARTGAIWASKDDPRITPIGKWLRRLRLDELPQFFNVLRGEMSIVGPRPERPEFVELLLESIPYYPQRLCVKPGITGWAQINHKYGDTVEDTITKLEYDLYYIKNLAPTLDAYIMFQTLKIMLLSRGAQ